MILPGTNPAGKIRLYGASSQYYNWLFSSSWGQHQCISATIFIERERVMEIYLAMWLPRSPSCLGNFPWWEARFIFNSSSFSQWHCPPARGDWRKGGKAQPFVPSSSADSLIKPHLRQGQQGQVLSSKISTTHHFQAPGLLNETLLRTKSMSLRTCISLCSWFVHSHVPPIPNGYMQAHILGRGLYGKPKWHGGLVLERSGFTLGLSHYFSAYCMLW